MRKILPVLVVSVLALAGCQKVNHAKTYSVEPFSVQTAEFPPTTSAQTVRATIDPESGPVSAYLVKTENASVVQQLLLTDKTPSPDQFLAGKTHQPKDMRAEIVLEAKVPAKTSLTLMIHGGPKATTVKVNVVGK